MLPENGDGLAFQSLKINKKRGVQIPFGGTPYSNFELAKAVAGWAD